MARLSARTVSVLHQHARAADLDSMKADFDGNHELANAYEALGEQLRQAAKQLDR